MDNIEMPDSFYGGCFLYAPLTCFVAVWQLLFHRHAPISQNPLPPPRHLYLCVA